MCFVLDNEDVSEIFVGSIFKGRLLLQFTLEDGTEKEFRNVVFGQPKPHTVGKPKRSRNIIRSTMEA
jgi:hypothetical protein